MTSSMRRVLVLTAVLTAVFTLSAWAVGELDGDRLARDMALIALNTLPLLAVGRNPLAVVLVFSVAYPLWIMSGREGHLLQSLPALTAMYLLGAWNRPLWLRAIGLITVGWMVTASVIGWWDADPLEVGYVAVMFVVVWALGVVVAARRSYAEQLEAKTVALEEARRELADRAVADERARIARELHDIIAHAMSVITIRAGVARTLSRTALPRRPRRWASLNGLGGRRCRRRVAIVDQGRVVALDTPAALTTYKGGQVRMTFTMDGHDPRYLADIPGVDSVTIDDGQATVRGAGGAAVTVAAALAARGFTPDDYRTHYPSLEDVFLAVAGRSLTEGDES